MTPFLFQSLWYRSTEYLLPRFHNTAFWFFQTYSGTSAVTMLMCLEILATFWTIMSETWIYEMWFPTAMLKEWMLQVNSPPTLTREEWDASLLLYDLELTHVLRSWLQVDPSDGWPHPDRSSATRMPPEHTTWSTVHTFTPVVGQGLTVRQSIHKRGIMKILLWVHGPVNANTNCEMASCKGCRFERIEGYHGHAVRQPVIKEVRT